MNSLVGPGVAAPFVGASSLTAAQAAAIGNGGGAGPVVVKTTNYAPTTADNGNLFSTEGATGTVTFTITPGLPIGTTFGFYSATANTMIVSFQGKSAGNEFLYFSNGVAGATATFTAAGCMITVKKVSNAGWPNNSWTLVASTGTGQPAIT